MIFGKNTPEKKKEKYVLNKLESEENIRNFEEKIILDKKIKKLNIYNQIVYFDKIIKNIYLECIKNNNILNIHQICDILNMNNLVVDIEDKETVRELKILREVSIRIIENKRKKIQKEYETRFKQELEQDIERKELEEKKKREIESNFDLELTSNSIISELILESEIIDDQENSKENKKIVKKLVEINKNAIKSIKNKLLKE